MKAGPFVSPCGITLSDALQQHEYKSVISTFQDTNNLLKLAAHRLKQLDTMVEETSKENIPSDLVDVIAVLTRATMVSQLLPSYIIIYLYFTFCVLCCSCMRILGPLQ